MLLPGLQESHCSEFACALFVFARGFLRLVALACLLGSVRDVLLCGPACRSHTALSLHSMLLARALQYNRAKLYNFVY